MRFIEIILPAIIAYLVYSYISGHNGYHQNLQIENSLIKTQNHTRVLQEKNDMIQKDIDNLRDNTNLDIIEDIARSDLGMIKEGETFYQVTGVENR